MAKTRNLNDIISSLKSIQNELLDMSDKKVRDKALHSHKALFPSELREVLNDAADSVGSVIYNLENSI